MFPQRPARPPAEERPPCRARPTGLPRGVSELTAAVALAALLLALPASASRAEEELVDGIAAQVGNDIVLLSEVLQIAAPLEAEIRKAGGTDHDVEVARQEVLERLIERRLIEQVVRRAELEASDAEVDEAVDQIAKQHGLSPEELRRTVEAQGLSYDEYRDRIRSEIQHQKILSLMVASRVEVEEDEVRRLYEQRFGDQPTSGVEAHLRHILVSFGEPTGRSPEEACARVEEARRRILAGEDFRHVAEEISEVSPERGGDVGWVHLGSVADWMAPVTSLEEGQLSEVLRAPFGCNLLQVVERREWKPITYEEARPGLYAELFERATEEAYREWIEGLRAQAFIDRKGLVERVPPQVAAPPPGGAGSAAAADASGAARSADAVLAR